MAKMKPKGKKQEDEVKKLVAEYWELVEENDKEASK